MPKMPQIRLLPNNVVNLIAAGEVMQRPSSGAKELLENSLDAASKNIQLFIEDGGKTLIQVIDDGCGMNEVDARMCFERHATSKIKHQNDLQRIHSYGFRGEAMSSMAAVAALELVTRTQEEPIGTRIVIEESVIKKQESVATAVGTQVAVRYLFRNVPGRRNFLKSNAIETKHVLDQFQRIALARPDVAFSFHQDSKQTYHLPTSTLNQRIVHLFGKNYQKQLINIEEKTAMCALDGFIGTPQEAKKTRGGQFFFVNKRFIKSPYLHHAVKKAFDKLLPQDTFPFYVLFIDVPPEQVDVNVHPSKMEVKFEEERLIYTLVEAAVRKALATHHCMHTIDFDSDATQALFSPTERAATTRPAHAPYKKMPQLGDIPFTFPTRSEASFTTITPAKNPDRPSHEGGRPFSPEDILPNKLQLHTRYILTQVKSGLLFIDQQAAYERILYERNTGLLANRGNSTQKLLFPYKVTLQPADMALLKASKTFLYKLGFQFTFLSEHEVYITGQPSNLLRLPCPAEDLIGGLLEQYKEHGGDLSIPSQEKWALALAKRSNIPEGTKLTPEAMHSLIEQLFACKNPNYTPQGGRTWHILALEEIKACFERGFLQAPLVP